jgi:bacteriocin-like protein
MENNKKDMLELNEEQLQHITGGNGNCETCNSIKSAINDQQERYDSSIWQAEGDAARGALTSAKINAQNVVFHAVMAKELQQDLDVHSAIHYEASSSKRRELS